MSKKSKMITVTVKPIPASLWKDIKLTAVAQERTVADVVTEALGRYVKDK
jgi:hypothetical protein